MTIKKKIAIVTNTSWNVYNFRMDLIHFLKSHQYEVTVIAPYDEYSDALQQEDIILIPLKNLSRKGTNPIRDLKLLFELKSILKNNEIGIALFYTIKPNIYGSIAGYLAGIKVIANITGLGYSFLNKGLASRVTSRLYGIALNAADYVVFQNSDDMQYFLNSKLVTSDKVKLISGSGVNTIRFSPIPKEPSINKNFLFVGRLLKDKGILEFIEAAEKLSEMTKDVTFSIIGDEDQHNPASIDIHYFKRELKKFPNISYHGKVNDVRPYLAACDIFVLPSYREGLPKSTLEALAMGKPVITTDVPGCRDTVMDGINGHLINAKSSTELFETMKKMISYSHDKIHNMGIESRLLAEEKYSHHHIVQEYLTIITSC